MSGLEWGIIIGVAVLLIVLFVSLEVLCPVEKAGATKRTDAHEHQDTARVGMKDAV